jgi:hypothetical protein
MHSYFYKNMEYMDGCGYMVCSWYGKKKCRNFKCYRYKSVLRNTYGKNKVC